MPPFRRLPRNERTDAYHFVHFCSENGSDLRHCLAPSWATLSASRHHDCDQIPHMLGICRKRAEVTGWPFGRKPSLGWESHAFILFALVFESMDPGEYLSDNCGAGRFDLVCR